MLELVAHLTPIELPSFGLALFIGFVAGVVATLAVLSRRIK